MKDEQIEQYFKGLSTPEEAAGVLQFLKENPGHPYLLQDWEQADGTTPLPGNHTQEMFDAVDAVISRPGVKAIRPVWKLLAAACLAGIIIGTFSLFNKKNSIQRATVKAVPARDISWAVQRNNSQKETAFLLADGSRITLSPGAWVRHRADFNDYERREIYMEGHVFFEVAKNKQKPFVVYSRNLSTTAVGTAFYVDAPGDAEQLNVKLFEGKVLIALTDTAVYSSAGDYYLLPGQEFVFNVASRQGTVRSFLARAKNGAGKEQKQYNLPSGLDESYMFNNQTLADVLDQLSAIYHTEIQYSKATVGNMYFIGKIDRRDSLDKIIHDIALLNKLSVTRQKAAYILRKK